MTGDWTSAKTQLIKQLFLVHVNIFFQKLSFRWKNLEQESYHLCCLQCQTHYHGFQLDFTGFSVNTALHLCKQPHQNQQFDGGDLSTQQIKIIVDVSRKKGVSYQTQIQGEKCLHLL